MPPPADITIEVFGKTDVGLVREHNEDNFLDRRRHGASARDGNRAPFSFKLGTRARRAGV
jgi:serine/threonine protein phosphatase PrpC